MGLGAKRVRIWDNAIPSVAAAFDRKRWARQRSMPPARLATLSKPGLAEQHASPAPSARPSGTPRRSARSRSSSPAPSAASPSGISFAPGMWPSGPLNSSRSRTSTTCTSRRCSSSQLRLHLPDAGERVGERRPVRIAARSASGLRLAAFQVRRHRDLHQLRMRQAEVVHVADEIALADRLAEPRVVELLLADAGGGEAAVVVAGIEQALVRQREDLSAHRAEQRARVALLEVGAAAAADQQRSRR